MDDMINFIDDMINMVDMDNIIKNLNNNLVDNKKKISNIKNYIDSMIINLNKKSLPKKVNLILDGGAFNGAYTFGSILYLKEMEKKNLIKIDKLSGTSIGSLLSVLYFYDKLDILFHVYENILISYKKNGTLHKFKFKKILSKIINKSVRNIENFNNKIYITYYKIDNYFKIKQVTVSKFKDNKDLIDKLFKSMYLPYITDGNLFYKNFYGDGCSPYIFNNSKNKKTIFIGYNCGSKIFKCLYTRHEKNIFPRLIDGIVNIHSLFTNNHSINCFYLNKYDFNFQFSILFRKFIFITYFVGLRILLKITNFLKKKNLLLFQKYESIFKNLFNEIYKDVIKYNIC